MLTVVIPTHNGAKTLPQVLPAFCQLQSPAGGWKLVVIDNGSTDATKQIVESFASRLPLKYVFEANLGKSSAANTGIENAEGDFIVFADDDVLPNPNWLVEMRASADAHPEFSLFGGAIVPHWEAPPEPWILKWEGSILAITGPDWADGPIAATQIYGPNMAVRSEVLRAGYRFDTTMGPVGGRYRMGEDTDFVQRLGLAGFRAWHVKRAVVAHMIRKSQMNKGWVLGRAFPSGEVSFWREFREGPHYPALLAGWPRYMLREIFSQALRYGRAALVRDSDVAFRERWQLHFLAGRAAEARNVYAHAPSPIKESRTPASLP